MNFTTQSTKVEFGDFQTPLPLAMQIVSMLLDEMPFENVIEPTCGLGSFLISCHQNGIHHSKLNGWEINPDYVKETNQQLFKLTGHKNDYVKNVDFFEINWKNIFSNYKSPILFIGNPPWVTNAELGKMLSSNLPKKYNFLSLRGLDAITGKSNFDISEWMLMKILEQISGTNSLMSFLVKTSVARKLFHYSSEKNLKVGSFSIRRIDAKKEFNVNVDGCLFTAKGVPKKPIESICKVYRTLNQKEPTNTIGIHSNKIIANIQEYKALSSIDGTCEFKWRSGVKHDCSKVMEFLYENEQFINGLGETISIPMKHVYPMYKSSDISKQVISFPRKYMLITQKKIGEDTHYLQYDSPETWCYLLEHSKLLDQRKSSIYKKAPRFSIFGVGEYTFSKWKIVVSGLYKNIKFSLIGSYNDKPIVLDDTCYMLGFDSYEKALLIYELLTSKIVSKFISSIIFLDCKRPITTSLLNRICLQEVARFEGKDSEFQKFFGKEDKQLTLFTA